MMVRWVSGEALNWSSMMPRDASIQDIYTSDRRCFSSLVYNGLCGVYGRPTRPEQHWRGIHAILIAMSQTSCDRRVSNTFYCIYESQWRDRYMKNYLLQIIFYLRLYFQMKHKEEMTIISGTTTALKYVPLLDI